MNYLYHAVPENMRGNVLYPLNTLKILHPDLYAHQVKKYTGREILMENVVPILDCLWNDVLHLTAIHPEEVKAALAAEGMTNFRQRHVYLIDPQKLDPQEAVVFLCTYDGDDRIPKEDCVPFDLSDMKKYAVIPQAAKDYYKNRIERGLKPLLYHMTPHILYRKPLDVSDFKIVSV